MYIPDFFSIVLSMFKQMWTHLVIVHIFSLYDVFKTHFLEDKINYIIYVPIPKNKELIPLNRKQL